jgi:hypothetical protein
MDVARTLVRVLLVAGLLAIVPSLALSERVVACSCMGPQPLEVYAADGHVIFAGRVDGRDAGGVRVAVSRWFAGDGAAPVVWITGDFGDGAGCGVGSEPSVGSQWIWVAWRPEDSGDPSISICAPTAELPSQEGQQLLAEAQRTFGSGLLEEAAPDPADPAEPAGAAPGVDPAVVVAGGVVLAAGILVLGGTALIARDRRAGNP